jgi:hypothetical protein
VPELRYQDLKSAAYIDAIIHFAETLLGIRLKNVKKYRYSSLCPFHADTKESLMVYVNKKDEVRLLNDETVKGYGYYCRQIDFTRKDQFSRNYSDYFAGRIVFPMIILPSITCFKTRTNRWSTPSADLPWNTRKQMHNTPAEDRA